MRRWFTDELGGGSKPVGGGEEGGGEEEEGGGGGGDRPVGQSEIQESCVRCDAAAGVGGCCASSPRSVTLAHVLTALHEACLREFSPSGGCANAGTGDQEEVAVCNHAQSSGCRGKVEVEGEMTGGKEEGGEAGARVEIEALRLKLRALTAQAID